MPWGTILNVSIKLLGFILSRIKGNSEKIKAAKEAYHKFIDSMEYLGVASVNLNENDRAQVDELRARRDRLNQSQSEDTNADS